MKSIRTNPSVHAAEGDERPKPRPATETDAEFLARLERIGRDYRYSDEFIGNIVRTRFPMEYP